MGLGGGEEAGLDRIRGELQAKLQGKAEELFKNPDLQRLLADAKLHAAEHPTSAARPR